MMFRNLKFSAWSHMASKLNHQCFNKYIPNINVHYLRADTTLTNVDKFVI